MTTERDETDNTSSTHAAISARPKTPVVQRCEGTTRTGTRCQRRQAGKHCLFHTPERLAADKAAKTAFLEALAGDAHGTVNRARLAAGVGRRVVYLWRHEDPEFAQAWDDAVDDDTDELEACVAERAKGWVEVQFDKQGNVVGERRQYSDVAATLILKARRPEQYRERVDLRHGVDRESLREGPLRAAMGDPERLRRLIHAVEDLDDDEGNG